MVGQGLLPWQDGGSNFPLAGMLAGNTGAVELRGTTIVSLSKEQLTVGTAGVCLFSKGLIVRQCRVMSLKSTCCRLCKGQLASGTLRAAAGLLLQDLFHLLTLSGLRWSGIARSLSQRLFVALGEPC